MKRIFIVTGLFLLLGNIVTAQVVRTGKTKLEQKPTTLTIAKKNNIVKEGNYDSFQPARRKFMFDRLRVQSVKTVSKNK